MDPHEHDGHLTRLGELKAKMDALHGTYDREAEERKHAEHMAEMDRIQDSLKQTQARLAQINPDTTVAQVRRMAEHDTHPTWMHAAYADLAQHLTRVEDRLDELADSLRMLIGQLAALEPKDRES